MEYIKLKDICETTQGTQIPKSNQYETFGDGLIRYLYIADFKDDKDIKYVEDKYDEKIVSEDDLVMANTGSPGAVFKGKYGVLSNNLFKISFDRTKLDKDFLYYYLSSNKFQENLQMRMKGGVQKHLGHKLIGEQIIPILDIETQKKIVEVLDKAQSLIYKKKEQIDLLDELVKSRFIEMFGDIRTNKKRWEEEELSNLLINIDSGKSFVCEGYERKGDYPAILKLSAVTYGVYKPLENKALINEEEFIDNMEVKEGDLLFTRKNTPELVGMSAYVYKTTPNLMMPDLIFRLNTNENCNKIYLWKLINNEMFREKIKMISNGSAKSMSNISKQNLMKLKIPVPPIELQNEFAEFVTKTDSIRSKMEASLSELEDNFNSLMQKAFKGELF